MKFRCLFILLGLACAVGAAPALGERNSGRSDQHAAAPRQRSGNPVFSGWYADPEAVIFGNEYWIYPTCSAPYDEQVFFDAFSSPDLVHWTKHSRILDTNRVTWARRAMWAPAVVERKGKYYFFFGANDIHDEKRWVGSEGGWTGPNYSVAYAIGNSPLGPFKRIGKVLQQDPAIATGAGHHSVLHVPGDERWYIVYHRRPLGETDAHHRVTCIDEMRFDQQGFIKPIKITNDGVESQVLAKPH